MTTELDTTRAVRAWLEEGVTRLPDRVLDSVLSELPMTPQQRRVDLAHPATWRGSTFVRLLVATIALAMIGTSLALATGALRLAPVPRPFDVTTLEAGRYVIDRPFPVRIGLDVPDGWQGSEHEGDTVSIVRPDTGEGGAALTFTLVDAIYPDPCHWADGSIVPVGPTVDDLASGLAATRGVTATRPIAENLGGYDARHISMTAPSSFAGCTKLDDPFHVWGLPEQHSLVPAEHDEIWIAQVGPTRLVVYSEVFDSTPPAVIAELHSMVASLRIGEFAPVPVPTTPPAPTPPPRPDAAWPYAGNGVPLTQTGFYETVQLYEYTSDGGARRLPDLRAAAFLGQRGWFGADVGIVSDLGSQPQARLAWWSVERVYLDPCHWQTSPLGVADPPLMRDQDGLTEALSGWWPTESDSTASRDVAPAPFAPVVTTPPKAVVWNGLAQEIELRIPADLDLGSCDRREYRLWETHQGSSRTGRPGERIRLDVVDLRPGLLVADASRQADASATVVDQLDSARDSLAIVMP
ncbi:MAG: hypothetical protein ACJ77D_02335 [Chloroflexota bacterium]